MNEVSAAVAHGAGERVLEQLELVLATDQRRDRDPRRLASVCGDRCPGPNRILTSANVHWADLFDFDPAKSESVGRRAYEDLSRVSVLLKARREVDCLARCECRIARVGHDLARLDADPRLELEVVDRVDDPERCLHGALRVVLVRLRDAERSHDRIARELLDLPAVGLDAAGDLVEVPRHAAAHDFGVGRRDERRRIDEVDEQDRCEFALHGSKCKNARESPHPSGFD